MKVSLEFKLNLANDNGFPSYFIFLQSLYSLAYLIRNSFFQQIIVCFRCFHLLSASNETFLIPLSLQAVSLILKPSPTLGS